MEENSHLTELNRLLKQALNLYEKDRKIATENYENIRKQLDSVLANYDMSEEGKLETELNKAVKLVFESGKRLDGVIQSIAKIITVQLNNESREKSASILSGKIPSGGVITDTIDINNLIEDNNNDN